MAIYEIRKAALCDRDRSVTLTLPTFFFPKKRNKDDKMYVVHSRDFYANTLFTVLQMIWSSRSIIMSSPFFTAIYKAAFLFHFHILTGLCFSSAGSLLHVFVFVLSLGNCGFLEWGEPACKCHFVNTIMRQWHAEFLVKQLSSAKQNMKRKPHFYLNCQKRRRLTSQSTREQVSQCSGSQNTQFKRQLHLLVKGKKSARMPRVSSSRSSTFWNWELLHGYWVIWWATSLIRSSEITNMLSLLLVIYDY